MEMETKAETSKVTCSHYFGYLSQLSREKEMPDECLICKTLIECKCSKTNSTPLEIKPKTVVIAEPKQPLEEIEVTVKQEPQPRIEPQTKTEQPYTEVLGNHFVVENQDVSYSSESDTVYLNKELLLDWGGKIEKVDIQTDFGKKMRCKVVPSTDPRKEVILIPDEIQHALGVKKNELVSVEPVILLVLENKAKNIVQAFMDFRKIRRKYPKQDKT